MLRIHRAERSSALADALGQVLVTPLADPFTAEVIAVPAKGVERWLAQRLSTVLGADTTDGVSANLAFPSPTRLVAEAISSASGIDPTDDPWVLSRVRWTLVDVIDSCMDAPWCAVLAAHLGNGEDGHRVSRRYATAARLSDLYRSYSENRPQMLVDWASGGDTDGAGGRLGDDLGWQAHLWRRLRERLASPSPAERLDGACDRLRDEPNVVPLPERLSLFGPTRLTTEQLCVLDALGAQREVHLWLAHPSPAMWRGLRLVEPATRRRDDRSALVAENPLLASLSRDARELQLRLAGFAAEDTHHGQQATGDTLLTRLQVHVRDNRTPTLAATPDGTVQVHACHGAPRQVEVLREALLHAFQEDRTLEPRDVLVMCPDVETYAPLIRAAFGQGMHGHPGHRLRVRLADRSLRQTNPLLDTVAGLLSLAGGRVTASQLLDLAASVPVRRRFGFSDDDLERLREWTVSSGARWGIEARERASYGLPNVPHNTWTTGLDRILLGVTADETELVWLGQALPLDDVDSSDIDLAGRLAELVDRLAAVLARLQGTAPAGTWTAVLSRSLDLLTDVSERDAWQLAQARRELAAATEHSGDVSLRRPDVRALLSTQLAGRPTRANFRTGELTVATLVPMRSVPHRVVALLGLDDEVFPRGGGLDGDDVLLRDPCVGERDSRGEDRQLLLDAVMSAGERLLVLYSGADPVTGAQRPPAVPLGELLDVIAATVGAERMGEVVTRHPLQPFDASNFRPEAPFSFDRAALAGARAGQRVSGAERPLLSGPLPANSEGDVNLSDLIGFLVHPVRGFLRQRLRVRVPNEGDDLIDALQVELDGLGRWDVGERMLAARLAGVDAGDFRQAEWRRGTLPPLRLGASLFDQLASGVEALAVVSLPVHAGPPATIDVAVDLGDGRFLTGTVSGVHGLVLASTSYSALAPKHRLAAWTKLLAVAASGRPGPWQAVTTGRGQYSRPAWRSTLVAPDDALDQLRRLVDLRDRGLRAPLPVATAASATYADRRVCGGTVEQATAAADRDWSGRFGDGKDRHLVYLHGPSPRLAQLCEEPPLDDERGWVDEPTRFGVLAARLWVPLLAAESEGQP